MTFALRTTDEPSLRGLAERQSGVVARWQLRQIGVPSRRAAWEIGDQRWQAVGSRVVALHNGELTRAQLWWAAVLHAGPQAMLCGLSAAEAAGLRGWESQAAHVVVPKGVRVPPLVGMRLHESRRLQPTDRHPTRNPPQTRLTRALVDAASWAARPELGCAILAAGVQQRLVRVTDLEPELAAAGQVAHVHALRLALGDIAGGSHSLSEIDFVRLCPRFGLPAPERQVVRTDRYGRRRYLDAYFRLPDGSVLVVEVDGALHLRVGAWWEDMAREREIVITTGKVLRFASVEIRLYPERVAADLRRAGLR
jgi:hypothetical protein